ncbi:MAG: aldo/keto reductase [Pseudomonadota bacterium]
MAARLNRRMVVGALAAAALPKPVSAATGVYEKTIPSTGEAVPAIGMGSWRTFDVGGDAALRAQRTQVLERFFAGGGRIIDSSPMYGSSQDVIGEGLQRLGRTGDVFAADKVWIQGGRFGPSQIEESRYLWGVDGFDLLQVHNLVSWRAHLETLFAMRAEGLLRYVGVTTYAGLRHREIEDIIVSQPIDFIQLTYNIADREAESRLLPLARARGVAVIANRPFGEGALIDYVSRFELPDLAGEIGAANWAQFLLKYIISHPAITAAIPATRRVDHMAENMGALTGPLPDADLRRRMEAAFQAL